MISEFSYVLYYLTDLQLWQKYTMMIDLLYLKKKVAVVVISLKY